MPPIPERRTSPRTLPEPAHPRAAIAPNAAFAREVRHTDLPLSVGQWLITLLVLGIPIVNVILYVYWAFFSSGNQGLVNFCRASLILMGVAFLIMLVFRLS